MGEARLAIVDDGLSSKQITMLLAAAASVGVSVDSFLPKSKPQYTKDAGDLERMAAAQAKRDRKAAQRAAAQKGE